MQQKDSVVKERVLQAEDWSVIAAQPSWRAQRVDSDWQLALVPELVLEPLVDNVPCFAWPS